ncbi:hypothetical protein GCM10029992_54850 [Glycomyces albus]
MLARTAEVARSRFKGPVTYAAAGWEERVDWSLFDLVGVSLYRSGRNRSAYTGLVRGLVGGHGKPVVITEFGCGAFTGADLRGAGSFQIVDWFAEPPRIRTDHPRDESVQAGYIGELIDLYDAESVHGCFVFTFAMPDFLTTTTRASTSTRPASASWPWPRMAAGAARRRSSGSRGATATSPGRIRRPSGRGGSRPPRSR